MTAVIHVNGMNAVPVAFLFACESAPGQVVQSSAPA